MDHNNFLKQVVIGLDEAGRGPLAGPVVAAGVILNRQRPIHGLRDSKKLTESSRQALFEEIMGRADLVAFEEVDAETIDRINILQATLMAFKRVMLACTKVQMVDLALIDGNQTVPGLPSPQQLALVKGDNRVQCIMAASIIAKVHRDQKMKEYGQEFPGYGFERHKGYGTKAHIAAIQSLGPCSIHRMSFAPLKGME